MKKAYSLADLVTNFFTLYLPGDRGFSPHTIASYRDTFKFFLIFVVKQTNHPITKITMEDISVEMIMDFLEDLENVRHNTISTRNVRLAALRSFFSYAGFMEPSVLALAQHVALIPFKKGPVHHMEYLNEDEIRALLNAPNRTTPDGRREYLILALLYDTAARASELLGLCPRDFRLHRYPLVTIRGKGNKERLVPLLPTTAEIVKQYLLENGRLIDDQSPLILNHKGQPMSRSGLTALVNRYRRLASNFIPALARPGISPHTFRHTKAMHLLQAGVHPVTIKDILGHEHLETLSVYARADLEMKRKALEKLGTYTNALERPTKHNPDLLEWLESL